MFDGVGAGHTIVFLSMLVGGTIWTLLFITFASHYFLAILVDSSAGNEEVNFPGESFMEWLWKPVLCLWVLAFCVLGGAVFLAPLMGGSFALFGTCLATLIWMMYPVGIVSVLYSQNWFFFVHPTVLWRMLTHYGAYAYVHLITLLSASVCVALLVGVFAHSFVWALPAAFVLPTALLFYARHWGRLAWLALNFAPRKRQRKRNGLPALMSDDDIPEMDVQEVSAGSEAVRAGLPPVFPHAIQTEAAASSTAVQARPQSMPVVNEEEDEWSTNKKPYALAGDTAQPLAEPAPAYETESDADKPISLSKYYEEKARQEKKEQKRKEAARNYLPPSSKRVPTFQSALFFGVWEFMLHARTLRVWSNLVGLTIVELFLLFMIVKFWPALN